MLIKAKKLLNLPVYTKSGQLLGEVDDIEIDIDDQMIVNYRVGSRNIVKKLLVKELVIHRSQIISITTDKIIVDDNVSEKRILLAKEDEKVAKGTVSPTINSLRED